MKINGTDIKEYNSQFLMKRLGFTVAGVWLATITTAVIVAGGAVFGTIMWIQADLSTALIIYAAIPAFCVFFVLPLIFLMKEKKGVLQELKSRCQTEDEVKQLDMNVKKIGKKYLLVLVGVILVSLVVVLGMILFALEGSEGGSSSENTCGSCGRSWSAGDSGKNYRNIARTGLCKNCESNYHIMSDALELAK